VSLRTRLQRLARRVPTPPRAEPGAEGADPPCPRWFDPREWASRMRVSRCSEGRLSGALRPNEYLPDMTEGERRYVDEPAQAFAVFARACCHATGSGPGSSGGEAS
jgi:hypothetical protein